MTSLMRSIADLALELHPDTVECLAIAISKLSSASDSAKIGNCGLHGKAHRLLQRLLIEWRHSGGQTPGEIAAALRSATTVAKMVNDRQTLELVWSGPDTALVAVRQTEQVLIDVIRNARSRLFMVSFVAYEVPSVSIALKDAVERGVRIEILLELSQEQGGKITTDSVAMMKKTVPQATIYVWTPDGHKNGSGGVSGSVHAKCAVADGEVAFVTSANLTKAALRSNMELGVLVRGGQLPDQLDCHLRALVTVGAIVRT
jgi:phosphatidylserine/phosphatidylglycerophosphate/cardiolipin synthase-like enzyme